MAKLWTKRARAITKNGQPVLAEDDEHAIVAQWLDWRRVLWWHTPNGGSRHSAEAAKLKRLGVRPGVPDFLIATAPPKRPGSVGTALELKALDGKPPTRAQADMLVQLENLGWQTGWFRGANAAIDWLEEIGY